MTTHSIGFRSMHGEWFSAQHVRTRNGEPTGNRKVRRIVLACILFAGLLIQLGVRLAIIEEGYRLEALRRETLLNDERLRAVRLEWSTQSRPSALADAAAERLSLYATMPQRIRRIDFATTELSK
ncbi:MAG: hypothetical protein KDD69_10735 [Bdellovibrionales bacterium]|nr:hypothetical protein [Bdellovibrionales bacterium]